jgi:hypothetical protein
MNARTTSGEEARTVERTALELGGDRGVLASGPGGKRHVAARQCAKCSDMRPWYTKIAWAISVDCAKRAAWSGERESASRWQRKTKSELGARRPCSCSFFRLFHLLRLRLRDSMRWASSVKHMRTRASDCWSRRRSLPSPRLARWRPRRRRPGACARIRARIRVTPRPERAPNTLPLELVQACGVQTHERRWTWLCDYRAALHRLSSQRSFLRAESGERRWQVKGDGEGGMEFSDVAKRQRRKGRCNGEHAR